MLRTNCCLKPLGIFWLPERVLTVQKGFCPVQLIDFQKRLKKSSIFLIITQFLKKKLTWRQSRLPQWSHLVRVLTFCQHYGDWILNIVHFHCKLSGMKERGVLACFLCNSEIFFVAWCDNCIVFVMWHRVVWYCYVYSTFAVWHINVFFSSHGHLLTSHNQWPVACIQRPLNVSTQSRVVSVYLPVALQPNSGQADLLFTHSRKDPLSEWSARRRDLHVHSTQQTHETNFHALNRFWRRDLNDRAAVDLRLRPHGHRNRPWALRTDMG
jgi:hypothetical protein